MREVVEASRAFEAELNGNETAYQNKDSMSCVPFANTAKREGSKHWLPGLAALGLFF